MSASLLDLMLPDGWENLLYSIVQGCVAVGCAYLLCGSSSDPRLYTGVLSAILSALLTYAQTEPPFATVEEDLTLAYLSPFLLSFHAAFVGMSVGVMLPLPLPGICFGISFAAFLSLLFGWSFIIASPILALVCALVSTKYRKAMLALATIVIAGAVAASIGVPSTLDSIINHIIGYDRHTTKWTGTSSMYENDTHSLDADAQHAWDWFLGMVVSAVIFAWRDRNQTLGALMLRFRGGYAAVPTNGSTAAPPKKRKVLDTDDLEKKKRLYNHLLPEDDVYNMFNPSDLPYRLSEFANMVFSACEDLGNFFGFQDQSVRNQAEHLLILLSNNRRYMTMTPTPPSPIHSLHVRIFGNYKKWCRAMGVRPNFAKMDTMCVSGPPAVVSRVVDLVLWFCIWGEAANIRHMPECLWYLYHTMMDSYKKQEGLTSSRSLVSGHFLDYVVTPIYEVIVQCKSVKGDHKDRKNYDDLNEFFWSNRCLAYRYSEIPLNLPNLPDVYGNETDELPPISQGMLNAPKTFLEKRSWMRGVMALNRIIEWHVVTFYLLSVIAFSRELVWGWVFSLQVASGVFWIFNSLGLVWEFLEVWASYPNIELSGTSVCGSLFKIFFRFLILIYQTLYLMWTFGPNTYTTTEYFGLIGTDANFWWWQYVWLSLLCMFPYAISALMNFYPACTTTICKTNNDVLGSFLNILYPMSRLYVGKEIHESLRNAKDYMIFWFTLIAFKLFFSYKFEVYAMVRPSLELTDDYINYHNHSFGMMMLLLMFRWLPQFLVYTIDMSIWYSLWQAFFGAAVGLKENLGAVREMEDVRKVFSKAPDMFCKKLLSEDAGSRRGSSANMLNSSSSLNSAAAATVNEPLLRENFTSYMTRILDVRVQKWVMFSTLWNEIIDSFREEDLISNQERKWLMFDRFDNTFSQAVYLPVFQTAGVLDQALDQLERTEEGLDLSKDSALFAPIFEDDMMSTVVTEAWELAQYLLKRLLDVDEDHQYLAKVITQIYSWSMDGTLCDNFKIRSIRKPLKHLKALLSLLNSTLERRQPAKEEDYAKIQDPSRKGVAVSNAAATGGGKTITLRRVMSAGSLAEQKAMVMRNSSQSRGYSNANTFPDSLRDKCQDLLRNFLREVQVLLKVENDLMTAEAANELLFALKQPRGFVTDDIAASRRLDELHKDQVFLNVVSKMNGLLNFYPDDVEPSSKEAKRRLTFFVNSLFMDMPDAPRMQDMMSLNVMTPYYSEDVILGKNELLKKNDALGVNTLLYLQTLYKNDWKNFVERMGYAKAHDDPKILQMLLKKHVMETRMWASLRAQTLSRTVTGMMYYEKALRFLAECERMDDPNVCNELIGEKFGYVVACQVYGTMKRNEDPKAHDIEYLMHKFPHMRVAYIDQIRTSQTHNEYTYFSVLVKSDGNGGITEVYRVRLPGNAIVGEGKPENQNHAIIFSRAEYVQTIDMNQEGYFEEAMKMRNVLQEFLRRDGPLPMTILGLREHIFTGSVSSLANYMALQETSFVTLGQRVLTKPLRMRFHYGHPDIFDKLFFITRGGISKSSKGINLSEDIFAGYNNVIRGGAVGFKEYMQVGKGRDVGMSQIYKFEAKLAQGNAEQSLSRDVYRLGQRLDFFRLFSMYFGGIGHYFSTVLTIVTVYVVVYLMAILALFDLERIGERIITPMGTIQMLLGGLGLLQTFPLIATLGVERGWAAAFAEVFQVFVSGGPLHFMFHIQTKANYMSQTILVGNAQYRATGRGFVTQHTPFDEQYRFFASSHLYLGVEITGALIVLYYYTIAGQYFGRTWSLWLASISFLASPFWFNPLTFDWNVVTSDYTKYVKWVRGTSGGATKSWSMWWNEENLYYKKLPLASKVIYYFKAIIYFIMGNGILNSDIFTSDMTLHKPSVRISYVLGFMGALLVFSRVFAASERSMSYVTHRVSSVVIFVGISAAALVLFIEDSNFIRYAISSYYFIGCFCTIGLLNYPSMVKSFFLIHDLVCAHILFIPLFILAALQVPNHIQTWLLYHNALSGGVVVDDILKYARKNMESGAGSEMSAEDLKRQIDELKLKLASQEKFIASGIKDGDNASETDRRLLLKRNESTDAFFGVSANSLADYDRNEGVSISTKGADAPKRVMSTTSMDIYAGMAMGADDVEATNTMNMISDGRAKSSPAQQDDHLLRPVDGGFTFSQPTSMPPR